MAGSGVKCGHLSLTLRFIKSYKKIIKDPCMVLNGRNLTVPELAAIGVSPNQINVQICQNAKKNMQENAKYFAEKIARGSDTYGVNTGYGGSADVRSDNHLELQKALVRHLNAGFGDNLPKSLVRSVMATRINSLAVAYSGVRPSTVQLLVDMLNNDIIPIVPKRGSVSASGDVVPTSYIAACMMGLENAMVLNRDQLMSSNIALEEANLQPVEFHAKEALAVVNASSFASSLASHVLYDANIALVLTQVATALGVESMQGNMESFHPTVHKLLPHKGQQEVAENITNMLKDSQLVNHVDQEAVFNQQSLKQDRYALRSSPQWLGPALESTLEAIRRVNIELNSANDNPIIDHKKNEILHCANFQGTSTTVAMDQTRQAIQLCGKLLHGQFQEIINVNMNKGLPPNLAGGDITTDFGFKGVDIAMASYQSELDYLTNNFTNHVLSAELHNQAINSMALVSARYTHRALEILQMMITNILCAQLQAIDLRYMQKRAECIVDSVCRDLGIVVCNPVKEAFPWYLFVFAPVETTEQFFQYVNVNKHMKHILEMKLTAQMGELVTYFRDGKHISDVEQMLGTGTRVLYSYIRREKNVPMYLAQSSPDIMLKEIYECITSQEAADLVTKIFESHEGPYNA